MPSFMRICCSLMVWTAIFSMQAFSQQAGSRSPNSSNANPAASEKFAQLSEQFMKDSLALSPTNASQAGYHKHVDSKTGKTVHLDALLDDLSLKSMSEQREFYQKWRDRFHRETPAAALSPEDAADWQLIEDQIGLNLLEFDKIQNYRHNPTVAVELVGNALFLPLTQDYAPLDVRLGHVLSRIQQIPRLLDQVKQYLSDVDPVFTKTAIEENDGNVDLIENTVGQQIPPNSKLKTEFDQVAPPAIAALNQFSEWLKANFSQQPTSRSWRLGKEFYDQKFRLVMETAVTPEQVLADAEQGLQSVRAEMLQLPLPIKKKMNPNTNDHSDLSPHDRENLIISEVLQKISDDHPKRDQLQSAIEADLESIKKLIRDKKIVSLGSRDNLKVIPTPMFMRGIYSVAGFHSA